LFCSTFFKSGWRCFAPLFLKVDYMSGANYGGKQNNNSSYIKSFVSGVKPDLWTYSDSNTVIKPSSESVNVLIPNDLTVNGAIYNPSDKRLKHSVENMPAEYNDAIMKLSPKCFGLNRESNAQKHFGLIAQELEEVFPNLVGNCSSNVAYESGPEVPYKSVNYLEIIPLLLFKIQDLQKQIDELKGVKD